ncbi:hypothetical protein Tco_0899992 [Tanacetum coccineum]
MVGSLRALTTPGYSLGPSTTPSYSPGPSTPPRYSSRPLRNAECANCTLLVGKLQVLQATLEMYMHPEKYTIDSTTVLHELYNDMANRRSLEKKGGPVSFQVPFEDTHSQKGVYINEKAQKLGEKFLAKHGPDKTKHPTSDMDLWNECTGGRIKGRTFCTSSLSSDPHYVVTGMPSTRSPCNPHPHCRGSTSMSKVTQLEEKMELQKQEHVTREDTLWKEFEDREASLNKQREEDCIEWQNRLRKFQNIMLEGSSHPPST